MGGKTFFSKAPTTNRYDTFPKASCKKLCIALFSQLCLLLKKDVQNQDLCIISPILEWRNSIPFTRVNDVSMFYYLRRGRLGRKKVPKGSHWLYLILDFWSSTWGQKIWEKLINWNCHRDFFSRHNRYPQYSNLAKKKKKSQSSSVWGTNIFTTDT